MLDAINAIGDRYGYVIANMFHIGDGNLHPLLLFDLRTDTIDRVMEASAEILKVAIDAGGALSGEHGIGLEKNHFMFWVFGRRGPRGDAARALRVRPGRRDESGQDLSGRRCLRLDPDGAHQARSRGGHVDLTRYALDGMTPARAESPRTPEDVSALIGAAHRARETIVLHGGGTRIGIGDAPSRYDTAVDLRELRGVVEHSAPDLVCIVRAGTTLAELAAALAPSRQRWPVDAPEPERATVGGTIASAAPAASRLRHQHVRDWVIGCQAVLGDGTLVRAGGRVVKNVTGYDLSRLYSGSYGTLAAITEVSLKLIAIDERTRTMRLRGERSDLGRIALELRAALPLEAIVLATGDRPALYVRAAGLGAAVDRIATEVGARGARLEEVADAEWSALSARVTREPFVARLALPPGREAALIDGDAVAYVGAGTAFLFGERTGAAITATRQRAEALGGALVLERASTEQKRALGVWGNHRATHRTISVSLKQRFDPRGVLAPGRFAA